MPENPIEQSRDHLERRNSGKRLPAPTNVPANVTPDGMPALVLKYAQRYCKDHRVFSLASLDILEYEQVLSTLGGQAADQLERLCKSVCTSALRATDRICFTEPGHVLILFPDTPASAATRVMERIAHAIASARLQYKNKPLRASGAVNIVACDTESGSNEVLTPDPEALLLSLGYKLDSSGGLQSASIAGTRIECKRQRPFSGSFSVWSDRYINIQSIKTDVKSTATYLPPDVVQIRAAAFDQWQGGRQVNMRLLELVDRQASFEPECLPQVARRARVLQQVEHPGLVPLLDYHAYEERTLYLISNPIDADRLLSVEISLDQAIDLTSQFCNILIYLQSLVPPLSPPQLSMENLLLDNESQLILVDYELPYLLSQLRVVRPDETVYSLDVSSNQHAKFGIENVLSVLHQILARAQGGESLWHYFIENHGTLTDAVHRLNSLFKVRAAFKQVSDEFDGREQVNA